MKMPMLHGSCPHRDFFIYTACDSNYFDQFGKSFINSVNKNTDHLMHIHIYNPTDLQLEYCKGIKNLSITYEYLLPDHFLLACENIESTSQIIHYNRTITAMKKSMDSSINDRIQKTYYACARFVRLQEIITANSKLIAVDSDAVIRKPIDLLFNGRDFYIHYIPGTKARYLAGGMMFSGNNLGYQFLTEYALELIKYIDNNYLYWSLDQDVLDSIVPKYNWGQLPKSYIDWDMSPDSCIWTAKGQRKDRAEFINEQMQYNS